MGPHEIGQGIVSLGEIFRPVTSQLEPQPQIAHAEPIVEIPQRSPHESSWTSLTIARARDVYFEVASPAGREIIRPGSPDGISQEQVRPTNYEKPVVTQEAEPVPAASKPLNRSAEMRTIRRTLLSEPELASVTDADKAATAEGGIVSNGAAEYASSRRDAPDADDEPTSAAARDQVLADWRRDDLLIDEAISLRTKEADDHYAAWPIHTAVAGGDWLVKYRRRRPDVDVFGRGE
jgi:hypothetical protein